MITNAIDYYNALIQIQDVNKPLYAILLPTDETIYDIDLDTRTVKAPKFLSLKTDHYAETIYFKMDRYFDNMDMADTVCTIQYINNGVKNDTGKMYLVPFYDIYTFKDENKILLPWQISGEATRASGNVTFSFRFFKLNDEGQYIYSLNTIPATSEVLHGMDLNLTEENKDNFYIEADEVTKMNAKIDALSKQIGLYWIDV